MGNYECDDGNGILFDGCDDTCAWETGWHCSNGAEDLRYPCLPVCGDKIHPDSPNPGNAGVRANVIEINAYNKGMA